MAVNAEALFLGSKTSANATLVPYIPRELHGYNCMDFLTKFTKSNVYRNKQIFRAGRVYPLSWNYCGAYANVSIFVINQCFSLAA